jgi:hypothetical protein
MRDIRSGMAGANNRRGPVAAHPGETDRMIGGRQVAETGHSNPRYLPRQPARELARDAVRERELPKKGQKLAPLPPRRLAVNDAPPPVRMREPFFAKVWQATRLPGKPPPVYAGGVGGIGNLGEQPLFNRQVHLDPYVARDLQNYGLPGARRNEQALAVLLHEYAHTVQPRVNRKQIAEGGAEAWAKRNIPRIERQFGVLPGFAPTDAPNRYTAYGPWTRRMQRRPLLRDYGQFGRRR